MLHGDEGDEADQLVENSNVELGAITLAKVSPGFTRLGGRFYPPDPTVNDLNRSRRSHSQFCAAGALLPSIGITSWRQLPIVVVYR